MSGVNNINKGLYSIRVKTIATTAVVWPDGEALFCSFLPKGKTSPSTK